MTAINIAADKQGAMIFTDGVWSDRGVITFIGNKVVHFPHLHAAAAATGTSLAGMIAQTFIGRGAHDFDGLVSRLVADVEEGLAENAEWIAEAGDKAFDIYVVGLSHKGGGFTIYSCSYEPGSSPKLNGPTRLTLQPYDERLEVMLDRAGIAPNVILERSPEVAAATMAEIMRVQREYARERDEAIGGFQQLTVLTEHACSSRLVNVWADRVGERMAA